MPDRLSRKDAFGMAASLGLLGALSGAALPALAAAPGVVGAWSLRSFEVDERKRGATPRFGPDPVGYLLYTASGRMSAVLSGTHRPPLTPPTSLGGSAHGECGHAVGEFLAYAGRYDVRGDRVFHHVEVSVFTNLVGTTLERQFTLDGNTLTIRTVPPEIWGSSNTLVWTRA